MISIFTLPKAFTGHIGILQENAIRSWKEECPNSEIILAANETGVSEFADKYRVRHIHDVCENELGSPMLNSLFQRAEEEASGEIMAYINTDCILVGNLEQAVILVKARFENFLMVGNRYDSGISQFPSENWKEFVLKNKGLLHQFARRKELGITSTGGTDIFVFSKGLYPAIPPFNIGAFFWDAWLIYDVWRRQMPIINITPDITIVHQKHTVGTRKTENFQKRVVINRNLCSGKKAARNADFVLENGIIQRDKGLSLFTHPRNFEGEFNRLQRNAIRSWLASCPNSEVVLLGKASGNKEMMLKFSRIWQNQQEIATDVKGIVRVKFIFNQGIGSAIHGILAYVNTDLILIGDLEKLAVIAREQFREFLIVGQKWNLKVPYEIDFMTNWQNKLKTELKNKGSLYSPDHIDYFIFTFQVLPEGNTFEFPDFLLGRPYWENWPISYAIANNIPVIDATNVITAIHSPHVKNIDIMGAGQYTLEKIINRSFVKNLMPLKNINESQFIFTKDNKIKKRE